MKRLFCFPNSYGDVVAKVSESVAGEGALSKSLRDPAEKTSLSQITQRLSLPPDGAQMGGTSASSTPTGASWSRSRSGWPEWA